MLDKSIKMNIKICERHVSKFFGLLIFAVMIMNVFTLLAMIAALIYLILAYRDLFDRSMFGEEAYTYMMVPISTRDIILGKTIAVSLWIMVSFVFVWVAVAISSLITGTWNAGLGFGNIGGGLLQFMSGTIDAIDNGQVAANEIIYERKQLIGLAVSLILMPIRVLSHSVLFCGVFQIGAIVRHLIDPQRNSGITTVGVVFGAIAVLLSIMAVTTGLNMLVSGDDVTIFTTVISIIIPVICGAALLAGSIKIMEKKYSLC